MVRTNTIHTQYEVWEYNPNSKKFGFPHGTYHSIQDAKEWILKANQSVMNDYIKNQGFVFVIIMQERTLIEL